MYRAGLGCDGLQCWLDLELDVWCRPFVAPSLALKSRRQRSPPREFSCPCPTYHLPSCVSYVYSSHEAFILATDNTRYRLVVWIAKSPNIAIQRQMVTLITPMTCRSPIWGCAGLLFVTFVVVAAGVKAYLALLPGFVLCHASARAALNRYPELNPPVTTNYLRRCIRL